MSYLTKISSAINNCKQIKLGLVAKSAGVTNSIKGVAASMVISPLEEIDTELLLKLSGELNDIKAEHLDNLGKLAELEKEFK